MKKHNTFEGEPDEMSFKKGKPEIEQPHDPKEPEISRPEIEELPDELSPDGKDPKEKPGQHQ